jgi:hypothetical protein
MLEMFDPLIDEIIKLVESQVAAASKKGEKIHVGTHFEFVAFTDISLATLPRRWLWRIAISQSQNEGMVLEE